MRLLATSLLGLAFGWPVCALAQHCAIHLQAGDNKKYDLDTVTVSASCPRITIELVHTGELPALEMGHNVVITTASEMAAVAAAGLKAGADADYVPKNDARVLAATPMAGGGDTVTATLPGKVLHAGGDYVFFCSFPAHSAVMKGKVVVEK